MEVYENLSSSPSRTPASDQLRSVAITQENTLEAINKFKQTSNEYGATNTEVIDNLAIDDRYVNPLENLNYYNDTNQYRSPE